MSRWMLLAVSLAVALAAVFVLLDEQTARANLLGSNTPIAPIRSSPLTAATDSVSLTIFPLPISVTVDGLIRGPDGNVWFAESLSGTGASHIGTITANGAVTDFEMPYPVYDMTAGPDGNIWYTALNTNLVVRVRPQGAATVYFLGPSCCASEIVAGSDGNLWVLEGWSTIDRVTPLGVVSGRFTTVNGGIPRYLALGADGNIWFSEYYTTSTDSKIGRITPEGVISEFPKLPYTATTNISSVALGPDGNIWFTEVTACGPYNPYCGIGLVNKITPDGTITRFDQPGSWVLSMTGGPGASLWGRDYGRFYSNIVRIALDGTMIEFTPSNAGAHLGLGGIVTTTDGKVWISNTPYNSGYAELNGLAYFYPPIFVAPGGQGFFPFIAR